MGVILSIPHWVRISTVFLPASIVSVGVRWFLKFELKQRYSDLYAVLQCLVYGSQSVFVIKKCYDGWGET
jgi:hypothetical protein